MFLQYFDLISPPITLFYKREERHINIISGVLSIITYAFIISALLYYGLEFYHRRLNTFYFYNTMIDDAGIFPLNSSSMFHYVTVGKKSIDFRAVNVIGINKYITYYMNNDDITKIDHWVYGPCNLEDAKGMENIIENKTSFLEAACVKKIWNSTEKKYYSIDDSSHFHYPQLEHGASNPLTKNYGVIITKCKNFVRKLNNEEDCYDSETIDKYMLESTSLALYVIDHSIEVHNFSNPIKTYLYKVTNGMLGTTFTSNQLNFDPVLIRSHNGIMFDHYDITKSYIYNQNAKSNLESGNTGILCCFYFWMQNRLQLYERSYSKIQECFANIGGLSKMIFSLSGIFNYLVNQYMVIHDSIRLTNKHLKRQENKADKKIRLNSSNQSLLRDLYNNNKENNFVNLYHNSNIKIKAATRINIKKSTIEMQKEQTTIKRKAKMREYIDFSFRDFILYLGFRCCRKFKNEVKGIERIGNLRRMILSEEFLFEIYFFFEEYHITLRKNNETNTNMNTEYKNSMIGN